MYSSTAVNMTNKGLYFVRLEKYAKPTVPRPRDANIIPPPQQRAANNPVKTESMLSILSFMSTYLFYFIASMFSFICSSVIGPSCLYEIFPSLSMKYEVGK